MTGGLYQKISGVWTPAVRPYVRQNGAWTGVTEAWYKHGGIWSQFWEYDITPSSSPTLSIWRVGQSVTGVGTPGVYPHTVGDNTDPSSNFLKVGVRLPDSTNDTDLKMIRVLTTYAGAAPTSQYGGTYTATPDTLYPLEACSDFYYNGWGPDGIKRAFNAKTPYYSSTRDSSVYIVKPWPLNATTGTQLPAGNNYITAWSQDQDGNWSAPTNSMVALPSYGGILNTTVRRTTYIYPNETGTYDTAAGTFTDGIMIQSLSSPTTGVIFYGTGINDTINTPPGGRLVFNSAKIQLVRANDSGLSTANVWAGISAYTNGAQLNALSAGTGSYSALVEPLGTITKGETKWFDLPTDWLSSLDTAATSINLWYQDPNVVTGTSADYSQILGRDTQPASGLIYLDWTTYFN